MQCDEVRDRFSARMDGMLDADTAAAVDAHFSDCSDCRTFARDLGWLSALTGVAARETAPPSLFRAVQVRLAEEARPATARFRPAVWRYVASLAAVCVLSVFGTWSVLRGSALVDLARHDAVAAHMRSLLQDRPIQVASGDPHSVRPWFNGKVEFAPAVKDLVTEGFPLLGARLDYVDGRRVAALVYKRRLHLISVFVWPDAGHQDRAGTLVRGNGYNTLSWIRDGLTYWAVSDLDPAELRELAAFLS